MAFNVLLEEYRDRIREALVNESKEFRSNRVAFYFEPSQTVSADDAWPKFGKILSDIEGKIAEILAPRSFVFWIHIYRRIGVFLASDHESNTDPVTIGLVRNIVEAAIQKFGSIEHARELRLSSRVNPDLILGGHMRRALKKVLPQKFYKTYNSVKIKLRARPEWILVDFDVEDYINIYRVEGLAYQYWRVTAAMRLLGKGGRLRIKSNGSWKVVADAKLEALIKSFDARNETGSFESTLVGLWFGPDGLDDTSSRTKSKSSFTSLFYNVDQSDASPFVEAYGYELAHEFTPNFLPFTIDARRFLEVHSLLLAPFHRRYGVSLEVLMGTILALSEVAFSSSAISAAKDAEEVNAAFVFVLLQLMQRAYKIYQCDRRHLATILTPQVREFVSDEFLSVEVVDQALGLLVLGMETQRRISLWTGGPRAMVVPSADLISIDLQGLPYSLNTLFVRLSHDSSARGTVFEETFRNSFAMRGFKIFNGELRADTGAVRELDLGVRVGSTLVIMECFSSERPMDYEIGSPKTFKIRTAMLDDKIKQVLSLAKFIEENPVSRQYDYSWATTIIAFVVSPFVEWVWELGDHLWIDKKWPRILSPKEAIEFVETVR